MVRRFCGNWRRNVGCKYGSIKMIYYFGNRDPSTITLMKRQNPSTYTVHTYLERLFKVRRRFTLSHIIPWYLHTLPAGMFEWVDIVGCHSFPSILDRNSLFMIRIAIPPNVIHVYPEIESQEACIVRPKLWPWSLKMLWTPWKWINSKSLIVTVQARNGRMPMFFFNKIPRFFRNFWENCVIFDRFSGVIAYRDVSYLIDVFSSILFMHILQSVFFLTNLTTTMNNYWRRVQCRHLAFDLPGLVASARGCTIGTEAPVALRQLQLQMSKPQVAIRPEGSLDPNLAKVTTTFLKVLLDGYLEWIFHESGFPKIFGVEIPCGLMSHRSVCVCVCWGVFLYVGLSCVD